MEPLTKKPINLVLDCSVCGQTAETFNDTLYKKEGLQTIRINTMTRGVFIVEQSSIDDARELFAKSVKEIHASIGKLRVTEVSADLKESYAYGQNIEGLDCYCPDCEKVYCNTHYNVKKSGSYSGSEANGTCPKGHQRALYQEFHSC